MAAGFAFSTAVENPSKLLCGNGFSHEAGVGRGDFPEWNPHVLVGRFTKNVTSTQFTVWSLFLSAGSQLDSETQAPSNEQLKTHRTPRIRNPSSGKRVSKRGPNEHIRRQILAGGSLASNNVLKNHHNWTKQI